MHEAAQQETYHAALSPASERIKTINIYRWILKNRYRTRCFHSLFL